MSVFDVAFNHVVGLEGGYSDNPADSGGPTKWGITERVARETGYMGSMKDLPIEKAREIYKARYWDLMQLDAIADVSMPVALELFDTGVNTGVVQAAKFLQRSLNGLNRRSRDYPDIPVDGLIGPTTVARLKSLLNQPAMRAKQLTPVLLKCLNVLQGAFYIELAEKREKDEEFLMGWILNRVVI